MFLLEIFYVFYFFFFQFKSYWSFMLVLMQFFVFRYFTQCRRITVAWTLLEARRTIFSTFSATTQWVQIGSAESHGMRQSTQTSSSGNSFSQRAVVVFVHL